MKSKRWLTVLFSVLIIFTLGCGFFTRLFPGKSTILSTVPPTLPEPPKPASLIKGTPEEQAVYFADMLASPDTRLAGWLGLYDALGIPVIGQDGTSLGSTGDDPIGPRYWQVWYASSLDKPGRGIPVSDAGRLLAGGMPELDGASFGPALLNDLRLAIQSAHPQVRLMGQFVRERIKRWPSHLDIESLDVTPEKAIVDLPTVHVIGWIVTRARLFQSAAKSPGITGAVALPAGPAMLAFQKSAGKPASQLPCSEKLGDADSTYWTNWIANKLISGGVVLPGMKEDDALKGLIEKFQTIDQASEATIKKTGTVITSMNLLAVSLSLLLQLAAMEIEPKQIPAPLKRTHHTSRGEDGTIELQLYSAPDKIPSGDQMGACIGAFLGNAFGVSFSFPAKGPISGAEMTVSGGAGFTNLVLFNSEGTNSMRRWTDKNGVAEYKLFGAPQAKEIPLTAKEVKKEFSVHVKAQPEEAGLNSMLNIFFGGLTFGANPTKAGGFGSAIDLMKGFQYNLGEYFFDLTDWQQQGYRATGQTADLKYSGTICDLEKPFTVSGSVINYQFQFAPSSATGGKVTITAGGMMVTAEGGGTYSIEGADSDKPRIAVNATVVGHTPVGSKTGSGTIYIDLVPLETGDCK